MIHTLPAIKKTTLITVKVKDGDFMEWLDLDLPSPLSTKEVDEYSAEYWNKKNKATPYEITFAVNGFFSTSKNKQYLHDISERIAYALNGRYQISEIDGKVDQSHELSRFTHIERVPSFNASIEANAFNGSRNEIFDALRYQAYRMFRTNSLNLEALTIYGNRISNNSEHVKYLAPNVFKWVETNYEGRQSLMTRSEAGRLAAKTKAQRVRDKVFLVLNATAFFSLSSDTISSLSRAVNVSRTSFRKYLNEWQLLKRAEQLATSLSTPYVRLVWPPYQAIARAVAKVAAWVPHEDFMTIVKPAMTTAPPD